MLRFWGPTCILILWACMALFGPILTLAPNDIHLPFILAAPNGTYWFGCDDLGRPIFDRLIMGANTSFIVAIWVVVISALTGTAIGVTGGYIGGWVDTILVRITDVFLAFPGILLAIALAGILGPGLNNVVIALSIVGWVGYARLARAQVLSLKTHDHVVAAIALGAGHWRIIRWHLIPLILSPLIIEATFGIAGVIIAEAGLSYLGLGVQAPEASWGNMIRDGARFMLVAPHMVTIPGIALMLVVLSVNLLGDRLRDQLDVKIQNGEQ